MSASLPSATALMEHADDPRHVIYSTWVIPHFFPYMQGLLNELMKQSEDAEFARDLLDTFAPPSNRGCSCVTFVANLRRVFKVYGEVNISLRDNQARSAVSVAMIYFILTTDFYFATPMTALTRTGHLTQLRVLNFPGPKFPAQLLN